MDSASIAHTDLGWNILKYWLETVFLDFQWPWACLLPWEGQWRPKACPSSHPRPCQWITEKGTEVASWVHPYLFKLQLYFLISSVNIQTTFKFDFLIHIKQILKQPKVRLRGAQGAAENHFELQDDWFWFQQKLNKELWLEEMVSFSMLKFIHVEIIAFITML